MGTTFFLSYAHDDDVDKDAKVEGDGTGEVTLVRAFHDDLLKELTLLKGKKSGTAGSFFDKKIPHGARWTDHLHEAVSSCETFVALMSANYFWSEWCGREWAVFEKRIEGASTDDPPRLLPLFWTQPPTGWKEIAGDYQKSLRIRERYPEYETHGLRRLVKFRKHSSYMVAYDDVVRHLAESIHTASQSALPPIAPDLVSDITPKFPKTAPAAPPAPGNAGPPSSRNRADFVALVARDHEVDDPALRLRYASHRWNWAPFASSQALYLTLQRVALDAHRQVGWVPDQGNEPPENPDALVKRIRAAENAGQVVVIVVDGWSTKVDAYSRVAQALDENQFINCVLVVVWRDDPPDPGLAHDVRTKVLWRNSLNQRLHEATTESTLAATILEQIKKLDLLLAPRRQPFGGPPGGAGGPPPTVSATGVGR